MTLKLPSARTLAKYGLDASDLADHPDKCDLCGRPLSGKQFYIDHEHRPGYAKLPKEQRKQHVRGLLHYRCNRFHVAANNSLTAQSLVSYFDRHEDRKRRQSAGQ